MNVFSFATANNPAVTRLAHYDNKTTENIHPCVVCGPPQECPNFEGYAVVVPAAEQQGLVMRPVKGCPNSHTGNG